MKQINRMKVKIFLTRCTFPRGMFYIPHRGLLFQDRHPIRYRTSAWQDIISPWYAQDNSSPVRLF